MLKKVIIAALFIVAGITAWQNRADLQNLFGSRSPLAQFIHDSPLIDEIRKDISLPPPLRFGGDFFGSKLTRPGVIEQTNLQRTQNGRSPLKENAELDAAAEKKVADMFAKQYFDHVSPAGVGPADLARDVGYEYVSIGENLALGNFKDDAALVTAWMNSPGHRANILNVSFQEIGVAVGEGTFEGKRVWLAVQEFGKPASACPAVDEGLKASIDGAEAQLAATQVKLTQEKAALDAAHPQTKSEYDAYNQQVAAYNALVATYNAQLNATKQLVASYNAEVQAFNACVGT